MIAALALAVSLAMPGDALDMFSGRWRIVGVVASADGKSRKQLVFDQNCSWTPRKAYLVCEQNGAGERPRTSELTLIWWNPSSRDYHFSGFGMSGLAADGKITIAGPVWTWSSAVGTTLFRTSNRFVRPGLVQFRSERSTDGGATWTLQASGSETRA
jgi:hypothetical protein